MIYNFRLVSDEVDNFKREIAIDSDASFLQLRNAICDAVGYDKNQMNSFFLCDDNWEKEQEITLEDMGMDNSEDDILLMEDYSLIDLIEEEGQRMIFVFDYMTDRCFFMELKKIETNKTLMDPVTTVSVGQPPKQFVDLDHFTDDIDAKAKTKAATDDFEFNDDIYGGEGYDEDDLTNLSDDTDIFN